MESRELSWAEGVVIAPLVAVIVALALYPGLILDRGEAAVTDKIAAVTGTAAEPAPEIEASTGPAERGWTGYAPIVEEQP
jgi:NADH:ubiquinone oxidoreductase subunit 4 (subunit M)